MNEKLIEKLSSAAGAIAQNRIIQTISHGLMALMPALMIGSIGSLLQQIPFEAYQTLITDTGLADVFSAMVNMTNNMLGVYATFSIAYHYAQDEHKDAFLAGFIAMISFLIVTPTTVEAGEFFATVNLPMTWLGSTGLFTGMIIALRSAKAYCWFVDRNLTIKLPDTVPPFINKSFAGIVPGICIATFWGVVNMLISMTPFGSLHEVVYGFIAAPLQNIGTTPAAMVLSLFLAQLCWFLGIHGMAIAMVTAPIYVAADAENIAAINAGLAAPNVVCNSFSSTVTNIGGAGCTLGLVILMLLFAKSKQFKSCGKLAIAPSIFGINEPVTYGVPCMLNPTLALPYIFLPAVFGAISLLLVSMGILPVSNGIEPPVYIPIMSGLINLGWRGAVWNAVEIVLSMLAYWPFFKILDDKAYAEEQGLAEEAA